MCPLFLLTFHCDFFFPPSVIRQKEPIITDSCKIVNILGSRAVWNSFMDLETYENGFLAMRYTLPKGFFQSSNGNIRETYNWFIHLSKSIIRGKVHTMKTECYSFWGKNRKKEKRRMLICYHTRWLICIRVAIGPWTFLYLQFGHWIFFFLAIQSLN